MNPLRRSRKLRESSSIVDVFLETDSPFAKKAFSLEYRPYRRGDDWFWFWVLHPKDMQRAVAHGEADSRASASIAARLKARELKGVISKVSVQESCEMVLAKCPKCRLIVNTQQESEIAMGAVACPRCKGPVTQADLMQRSHR